MRPDQQELLVKIFGVMFIILLFLILVYGVYNLLLHIFKLILAPNVQDKLKTLEANVLKLEESIEELRKNKIEDDKIMQKISKFDKNNIEYLISYLEKFKSTNELDKKNIQIQVLDDYIQTLQSIEKMLVEKALLNEKLMDKEKQIRILLNLINTYKKKNK